VKATSGASLSAIPTLRPALMPSRGRRRVAASGDGAPRGGGGLGALALIDEEHLERRASADEDRSSAGDGLLGSVSGRDHDADVDRVRHSRGHLGDLRTARIVGAEALRGS
jgi:hypothetical protein